VRLYVQIVSKAYQAEGVGVGTDADSNRNWVETLIQGARMLCRVAQAKMGLDGIKEAEEGGSLIEKAKSRLDASDDALVTTVDLAEGIWSSLMALKGQWWLSSTQGLVTISSPRARPTYPTHPLLPFTHPLPLFRPKVSYRIWVLPPRPLSSASRSFTRSRPSNCHYEICAGG
jgi:hypothetical protein